MLWILIGYFLVVACAVRVLLRPHREPTSRIAWLAVIFALPGVGLLAYLLLGETSIGGKRAKRLEFIATNLPRPEDADGWTAAVIHPRDPVMPLFNVGLSISGYEPAGGNHGELMPDSDGTIDAMVADIDAARDHVHLVFYIWLPDKNGLKVADALIRAADRGVAVRALVDDLGSRDLIRSKHWKDMASAGVALGRALKIGIPVFRIFHGRIDLRNHRKIVVIDNSITYCGSQNCADPEFLPKADFAPWVDAMIRFEGPVARQNQHLFAMDWMATVDEDLSRILRKPLEGSNNGFPAQVIGTGPTARAMAMAEMFVSCMYAARRQLTITTPYYVPSLPVQGALTAAARRGVETAIVLPQRNDDFAVGATARSYYEDLLTSGVRVFEYRTGLLHTKSMTIDGDITLIGSANLDRRSFDLNYENNILLQDAELTAAMRLRQKQYIEDSDEVRLEDVQAWPWQQRLWNNALAVVGPVL